MRVDTMVDIHPAYDPKRRLWFTEEYTTKSLSELAQLCPNDTIVGYYPNGMPPGLICRNGSVGHPRVDTRNFTRYTQLKKPVRAERQSAPAPVEAPTAAVAPAVPVASRKRIPRAERISPEDYQLILDMWAAGKRRDAIALVVNCRHELVTQLISTARLKGDPRAVRRNNRVGRPSPFWSAARDAELQRLFFDGLTASQIAVRWHISRNAVLGRKWRLQHARLMPSAPSRPLEQVPEPAG